MFIQENLRFKEISSHRLLAEENQKPKVGTTPTYGSGPMSNENIMIYIWFPIVLLFGTIYIL